MAGHLLRSLPEPFTLIWYSLDTKSKWMETFVRFWGPWDIYMFITNVSDKTSIRLIAFLIVI